MAELMLSALGAVASWRRFVPGSSVYPAAVVP
jgi:hypothetical protein